MSSSVIDVDMAKLQAQMDFWRTMLRRPDTQEYLPTLDLKAFTYWWEDYDLYFYVQDRMRKLLADIEANPGLVRRYVLEEGRYR